MARAIAALLLACALLDAGAALAQSGTAFAVSVGEVPVAAETPPGSAADSGAHPRTRPAELAGAAVATDRAPPASADGVAAPKSKSRSSASARRSRQTADDLFDEAFKQ